MVWKTHENPQGGEIIPETGHSGHVFCDPIPIVWELQMRNDMVEEESSDSFWGVVERRNDLHPFHKVINYDDYVVVATTGGWSTLHEVNEPLVEGSIVILG